jgi:hypothetical protein
MDVVFTEKDALFRMTADELARITVNENGATVHPRITYGDAPAHDAHSILVGSGVPQGMARFLRAYPDGGLLRVSARPGLVRTGELRRLVDSGALGPRQIALFGTRAWSADELAFASSKGVQCYSMLEISREGLAEMTDAVMAYARLWSTFHLVIDLDALDPAFAPGLRAQSPGGLSSRELFYLVQRLRLIRTLASVEIIAAVDVADASTAALLARLLAELQ